MDRTLASVSTVSRFATAALVALSVACGRADSARGPASGIDTGFRGVVVSPPIPKPAELSNPDEIAARFGIERSVLEEPSQATTAGADRSGLEDKADEERGTRGVTWHHRQLGQ